MKKVNLLEMHLEKGFFFHALIISFFLVFISCSKSGDTTKMGPVLDVKSPAFGYAKSMSDKFTCDGADISPPLEWKNAPAGTRTFAVICETPDAPAGNWVHWVIYDIPADAAKLNEAVAKKEQLENGARQGKNDYDQIGYGGPCYPAGEHRFFFRVYALDVTTNLRAGVTRDQLLQAMQGHILAEGVLMSVYARE